MKIIQRQPSWHDQEFSHSRNFLNLHFWAISRNKVNFSLEYSSHMLAFLLCVSERVVRSSKAKLNFYSNNFLLPWQLAKIARIKRGMLLSTIVSDQFVSSIACNLFDFTIVCNQFDLRCHSFPFHSVIELFSHSVIASFRA